MTYGRLLRCSNVAWVFLICSASLLGSSYVANQSGDATHAATYNTGGTCGSGSVAGVAPAFGDSINACNFALTIPTGESLSVGTCRSGSDYSDADLETGETGSLVIQGTLNLRGNAPFDDPSPSDGLTSALTLGAGSTVTSDCGSSYVTKFFPKGSSHKTIITVGTKGTPWKCLGTVTGCGSSNQYSAVSPGNSVRITDTGGGTIRLWDEQGTYHNTATLSVYGAVVDNCGDATHGCTDYGIEQAGSVHGKLDIETSSFNTSGPFGNTDNNWTTGSIDSSGTCTLNQVTATNSPATFPVGDFSIQEFAQFPCVINNSMFRMLGDAAGAHAYSNLFGATVGSVYFTDWQLSTGSLTASNQPWTDQGWNLFHQGDCNQASRGGFFPGSIQYDYIACESTGTGGNNATVSTTYIGASIAVNVSYQHLVYDIQPSGAMPCYNNHMIAGTQPATAGAFTFAVNDITLAPNNSCASPSIGVAGSGMEWTQSGNPPTINITHYTAPMTSSAASLSGTDSMLWFNEGSALTALPSGSSFRRNLAYTVGSYTAAYSPVYCSSGCNSSSTPGNMMPPGNVGYDDIYGAPAVSRWTTTYNPPCSSGTPCTSNGTHYDYGATGAAPGTGDLQVTPSVLDTSRTRFTWASRTQGQAASEAGVEAAFMAAGPANFTSLLQSMWYWVRAGSAPLNPALWNSADDGSTIGSVQMRGVSGMGMIRQAQ